MNKDMNIQTIGRHTERLTNRLTDGQMGTYTHILTGKQRSEYTDRGTNRQTKGYLGRLRVN